MSVISRRAVTAALAAFPFLTACNETKRLTGGDPLVDPGKVRSGLLRRAAAEPRLKAFYEARNWRPAWTAASAGELQDAFRDAPRHAIDAERFTDPLKGKEDPVAREVALTSAALAYGDALAHGLADPGRIHEIFALERNTRDVDASLLAALDGKQLSEWLFSLPPLDADYGILSRAYLDQREKAKQARPDPIPEGRLIKPGSRDPRMPQIAAQLQLAGYLQALSDPATPDIYGPALVEAMKAYQNDHGLNTDGVIGADAIALLNAGPDDRARQLALNLEARRWLKREVPPRRIDVNTACAVLTYRQSRDRIDQRRVVVGKPGDETPNLAGGFSHLVVNPPWNVPEGIAAEEILPKGAGYMAANDMSLVDGRVVQKPGPKSALGLVKFDMQNKYAIYLHDTPAKDRFQANERHFSHGCVRVDNAVEFARSLAAEHGKAPEFDEKLAAGETATVELGAEIPVRLMYHTVFVDPQGRVGYRPDVYGWDAKLAATLGMNPPLRQGLSGEAPLSIGP